MYWPKMSLQIDGTIMQFEGNSKCVSLSQLSDNLANSRTIGLTVWHLNLETAQLMSLAIVLRANIPCSLK